MTYQDFVIAVDNSRLEKKDGTWMRGLDVRVARTTQHGDAPVDAISTSCDERALKGLLAQLDSRELDRDGLFKLGRMLALLLLPAKDGIGGVRELLARSLDALDDDEGLRLRLILPADLAALPWEYLYLDRTGGSEDSMNGFIALDPRIAILRNEGMPLKAALDPVNGDINVLAALASNIGLEPLDLDGEEKILRDACGNTPGLTLDVVREATLAKLETMLPEANIFHFAGHGAFRDVPSAVGGVLTGRGLLAFEDELIDAEQLGINLHRRKIQLAVLGGCETGKRVGPYTAGSIAVGLARSEIPAVVANQYAIHDTSAKEFTRAFYSALAGGLPLESAVHAGRLAVYTADPKDRDWGVPVLYLRAPGGALFSGAADAAQRKSGRDATEARVSVRAKQVGRGGIVTGAKLLNALRGNLDVRVTIDGDVYGEVVGAVISRNGGGGSRNIEVNVGEVGENGSVTGAVFGDDGDEAASGAQPVVPARSVGRRAKPPAPVLPPQMSPAPQPPPVSGAAASTTVNVDTVSGGTVIGTQDNSTHFTYVAPAARDPDADLIQENLRLDLRAPQRVVIDEPFDVQVQIKLPQSPPIGATADTQVASSDGSVFRREESEVINYKIVPTGDGFRFEPPHFKLRLYPKTESPVVTFEAVASKSGQRKLRLNAYQDDETLAAQTALTLEIVIVTAPKPT